MVSLCKISVHISANWNLIPQFLKENSLNVESFITSLYEYCTHLKINCTWSYNWLFRSFFTTWIVRSRITVPEIIDNKMIGDETFWEWYESVRNVGHEPAGAKLPETKHIRNETAQTRNNRWRLNEENERRLRSNVHQMAEMKRWRCNDENEITGTKRREKPSGQNDTIRREMLDVDETVDMTMKETPSGRMMKLQREEYNGKNDTAKMRRWWWNGRY